MFAVYVLFCGKGTVILIKYQKHEKSVKFPISRYHKHSSCQIKSKSELSVKTRKVYNVKK